ncbi:paraflagellar rod component 1 / PFC1 [Leishmania donovani]|uniref:Hypothetical_protein_conserved n=1 Tax=Leishmania donovani TaxID=5661 RepID=A0A6J8FGY3_LEIDO|nr:paraflagellar rod component 1 / PFC1 [Leishmania donovani]VDZ45108.1 hypothetical_protein_conserved [Leishmania donovani]
MTTMARVDETLARFKGKSPRDSYKQVCGELDVHMQREIYAALPEKPMAWHHIYTLDLGKSLLGTKGCMAMLPLITVSTSMRKLSLRSCGLSDEFVIQLCAVLQSHPSLRSVDISDNELVTVYSAPHIISVMRNNSNMVLFDVYNTHVGSNVGDIIAKLGQRNLDNVLHYYEDRYFRMKNLFNYMDADGTGWVVLKSLVLNCPYPVLQEQFVERIATKQPRKRSDNTISINTFLQLVYMNYKTETEIGAYSNKTIDEPYVFIVANWKQLLHAVERYNVRAAAMGDGQGPHPPVQLPDNLHRWRLRDYIITPDDADAMVEGAVQLIEHSSAMAEGEPELNGSGERAELDAEVDSDKQTAENAAEVAPLVIPITILLRAAKSVLVFPPSVAKPSYSFYTDHDAAYVPEILRNGSRLFSVSRLSCLFSGGASTPGDSASSADVVQDSTDQPHTFSLPASVVKMVVDFFNKEHKKLPTKKQSVIPDSPRTRRDKAMEKASIPVPTFLSAEFVSDLERVCPRFLADYYARHALLIEDGTITLQEMVNVLDEMYAQCRIDRLISLADIKAMPDPMKDKSLVSFVTAHFADRDEGISFLEPFNDLVAY